MIEVSSLRAITARKEGQERLENLDELINAAASFVPSWVPAIPGDLPTGSESLLAEFSLRARPWRRRSSGGCGHGDAIN